VRRATAGEFEILGELGRRTDGGIAYLARDLVEPRLVALRLEQSPGGRHNYVLDVLKELDATLPSIGKGCPRCSAPPRGWGRYCPACGFDLSGLSETRGRVADTKLQSVVKAAAGDDYQILGEMPQAEGGGAVFFARERGRRTIVGLRVRKGRSRGYALERTAILPLLTEEEEGADSTPSHSSPWHQGGSSGLTEAWMHDESSKPTYSRSSRTGEDFQLLAVGAALAALALILGGLL
jgi:hypothetical protein